MIHRDAWRPCGWVGHGWCGRRPAPQSALDASLSAQEATESIAQRFLLTALGLGVLLVGACAERGPVRPVNGKEASANTLDYTVPRLVGQHLGQKKVGVHSRSVCRFSPKRDNPNVHEFAPQ